MENLSSTKTLVPKITVARPSTSARRARLRKSIFRLRKWTTTFALPAAFAQTSARGARLCFRTMTENLSAMYRLETERLSLVPLTSEELSLLASDVAEFQTMFGLDFEDEPLSDDFCGVLLSLSEKMKSDPFNAVFYTVFLLIPKNGKAIVGSVDFKNAPTAACETEIGYSLGKAHRGKGYMTEAVSAFSDFALFELGVRAVTAQTETGNVKSENVLMRSGFCAIQNNPKYKLWKKE